ncbi:MAG: energy transducer TonB [Acidobacteriia bacterium]|nr:energy transducer TonB [Terriglobia bacterium]
MKKLILPVLMIVSLTAFAEDTPKRVPHATAVQSVTTKIVPDYSPIAKQLKIQGSVELEAVIAEDGSVEKVNIISGNPVLTKPASEALKKWKFKPFLEGDKPIKVVSSFDFDFKL